MIACTQPTAKVIVWESEEVVVDFTARNLLYASVSPNNKLLACCDRGCYVSIVDIASGVTLREVTDPRSYVWSACFSRDSRTLVCCSVESRLLLWDGESGDCLEQLGHSDAVNQACFSRDGCRLISCSKDETIKVWNFSQNALNCLQLGNGGAGNYMTCMRFSKDGKFVFSSGSLMIY